MWPHPPQPPKKAAIPRAQYGWLALAAVFFIVILAIPRPHPAHGVYTPVLVRVVRRDTLAHRTGDKRIDATVLRAEASRPPTRCGVVGRDGVKLPGAVVGGLVAGRDDHRDGDRARNGTDMTAATVTCEFEKAPPTDGIVFFDNATMDVHAPTDELAHRVAACGTVLEGAVDVDLLIRHVARHTGFATTFVYEVGLSTFPPHGRSKLQPFIDNGALTIIDVRDVMQDIHGGAVETAALHAAVRHDCILRTRVLSADWVLLTNLHDMAPPGLVHFLEVSAEKTADAVMFKRFDGGEACDREVEKIAPKYAVRPSRVAVEDTDVHWPHRPVALQHAKKLALLRCGAM